MEKRYKIISVILLSTFLLTGCGCKHKWISATCEKSAYCELCGKTKGNLVECVGEDKFETEATLSQPGKKVTKCKNCGKELSVQKVGTTKVAMAEEDGFNFTREELEEHLNIKTEHIIGRIYQYEINEKDKERVIIHISENLAGNVRDLSFASVSSETAIGTALAYASFLFHIDTSAAISGLLWDWTYEENNIKLKVSALEQGYSVQLESGVA